MDIHASLFKFDFLNQILFTLKIVCQHMQNITTEGWTELAMEMFQIT